MDEHPNGNGVRATWPIAAATRGWLPRTRCLTVTVREFRSTLHLRLTGEFDLAGVRAVENALERLDQAPAPRRLVFDLRGLTFLDIAGLRTILGADARGRAEEFEVVVVRPRGIVNRVFTLTRAGEQLSMVDDLEAR
jgi:anti-anti-sigma factor